jgi:hypothetical protein
VYARPLGAHFAAGGGKPFPLRVHSSGRRGPAPRREHKRGWGVWSPRNCRSLSSWICSIVLEKLSKAAYIFHTKGSAESQLWVRLRAQKVLEGHVSQVVQGIRQTVTKHRFRGSKRKTLSAVANYLYRSRGRMSYHQYLAQGLPSANGAVEGVCKSLIKDRMERSGMRWTEAMAEAIVKLRAIYLSGDFDQYSHFHIKRTRSGSTRPADGPSSKSSHTVMISHTSPQRGPKIGWRETQTSCRTTLAGEHENGQCEEIVSVLTACNPPETKQ